jgi:hypothetical protein
VFAHLHAQRQRDRDGVHGDRDRENDQFVWEISYEGPESFAERNQQYWDSPKREAMDLNPEDYLVSTEVREVVRVY